MLPRRFRGAWLAAFNLAWIAALLFAIGATVFGVDATLDRYRAAAQDRAAESATLFLAIELAAGLAPNLLLIGAAMVLRRSSREEVLAGALSLCLLLIASSNFIAKNLWLDPAWTSVGEGLDNLGWFGVFLVLVIPLKGPLRPPWLWLIVILLFPLWLWQMHASFPRWTELPIWILTMGCGVAIVAARYRRSYRQERQRVRWLLAGFALGTLAVGVAYLLDGRLGWSAPATFALVYSVYAFGICAFVVGLLVAVQKYGLYDSDAFLTRTVAYSALALLAAGVYALASTALGPLLQHAFEDVSPTAVKVVGAVLVAAAVAPLREQFEGWADRRFRRQLKDLAERLPVDIADLSRFASQAELLDELLDRIAEDTGAENAAVLDGGEVAGLRGVRIERVEQWMKERLSGAEAPPAFDPADTLFPVRIPLRAFSDKKAGPLGWLLIGPRRDDRPIGLDERDALRNLSQPLTRALLVIQRRESADLRIANLTRIVEATEPQAARVPPAPTR